MSHPVIVSSSVTTRYRREYTDLPKKGQPENSEIQKIPGLIERIGDAIGTQKTGEMAEFFGKKPPTISDWKAGRSGPTLLDLLTLAEFGNPELTLKEVFVGPVEHKIGIKAKIKNTVESNLLNETEEQAIIELARERDIPLEEMVRTIVVSYLLQQGLITLEEVAEASDKVRVVGRARGKREPMDSEIYEVKK
ncbi:MAG TPA: hypothetical protein VFA21_20435 [Pyrinomonadaceae bacterium]|nr:hypothetical protein [Pyrinomonadaceae bacterium]